MKPINKNNYNKISSKNVQKRHLIDKYFFNNQKIKNKFEVGDDVYVLDYSRRTLGIIVGLQYRKDGNLIYEVAMERNNPYLKEKHVTQYFPHNRLQRAPLTRRVLIEKYSNRVYLSELQKRFLEFREVNNAFVYSGSTSVQFFLYVDFKTV